MSNARVALVKPTAAPIIRGAHYTAEAQLERALDLLHADFSDCPRWPWPALDDYIGPLLPGELHVFGATTGGGKSTVINSLIARLSAQGYAIAYAPLEVTPEEAALSLAALDLGYDARAVGRHEWQRLPAGAQDQLAAQMKRRRGQGLVHFLEGSRPTVQQLENAVQEVITEVEMHVPLGLVIVDHFQHLSFPTNTQRWVAVTETAQRLKEAAQRWKCPVLCTVQLTRTKADTSAAKRLASYMVPSKEDIKEASAIAEEASVVLTAARKLREGLAKEELAGLRNGTLHPRQFADPGIMQLSIEKHRLDGSSLFGHAELYVDPCRGVLNTSERPTVLSDDPR